MNMKDFNSKEYAWIDVTVVVLGVEVKAIRGVEYKTTRATEALYAAGKAKSIEEGVGQAKHLIDSGAALEALNKFVEESNK